jgi:hypothetical protein
VWVVTAAAAGQTGGRRLVSGGGGGGAVVETKQWWQAWAAAGQTQSKKKKKKKKKTSFLIGHVRLRLVAGWVPVDLAEVVAAAAKTAAGMGSSGSDWRASGMGVQAVSRSQKKKKRKKKRTYCSIGHIRLHLTAGWVPVNLAEVVVAVVEMAAGMGSSGLDWRASSMGV